MIRRVFSFVLLTVLASLSWSVCASVAQGGVEGIVYWIEGNQMPGIDGNMRGNRSPVKRTLYFFEPISPKDVKGEGSIYKIITGTLIEKVDTDENGYFRVKLDPGKYSVFVKEKEGWFASTVDGEHINPVFVKEGEYTRMVIDINYKAYY